MAKWTEKIPSILWIPIIIGAIALFIGALWMIFYGFGFVEGFGSLIMLALGWFGFRVGNNSDDLKMGKFGVALGITFFAGMGIALDQTGNFIYNQPIEWIYCPENTQLFRETIQRGVRGGGVSIKQNFACLNSTGEVIRQIGMFEHLAVRFVEYVFIGYILLGLSRFYSKVWRKRE
jgi:hypothetical protein